jgi:serine protease Do
MLYKPQDVARYRTTCARLPLRVGVGVLSLFAIACAGSTGLAQVQPGNNTAQENTVRENTVREDAEQQRAIDGSGLAVAAALEQATMAAIESAERSVVAIARVRRKQAPAAQIDQLRMDRLPLGNPFPASDQPDSSDYIPKFYGSGIVLSDDGYIVTCGHVLEDPRQHDYFVWLGKQSYAARVVGLPAQVQASDPFSDLAVLKIDASNLQAATWGSGRLRKGQFVIALGNPQAIARDGQVSASWGIVSNLNRMAPIDPEGGEGGKETIHHFGTLIQTDAKLNLGMSGGALVNLKGEVVGLTTALAASAGFEQSAGFAIAVDPMFLRVVEKLKAGKLPEFGFLGIQPEDLRYTEKARGLAGARVSVVIPGLPGEQAGLRSDDVIYQVNEEAIADRNDLFRELSQSAAGAEVQLYVYRFRPGHSQPEQMHLPATLSKKPINLRRPGYALHGPNKWRGLLVDYATAVSSELLRTGVGGNRRQPVMLAILSVDPDTPAWRAGVRPGQGLLSIAGEPLASPDEFYRQVQGLSGVVELSIVHGDGRSETLQISPVTE